MSDPGCFWERELFEERDRANRLEREAESLRSALAQVRSNEPLVDLVKRLATELELREFHFDDECGGTSKPYCFSCNVTREKGAYGWKLTHSADCSAAVAMAEAESLGWERD